MIGSARPIVVGFDGSASSEHALAYAAGVARRLGTRLVVVHVHPWAVTTYAFAPMVPPDLLTADDDLMNQRISHGLGTWGIPWTLLCRTGTVHLQLEVTARELRADVLVVGRSHHMVHRFFGSVGARIARHCEHPIIVVP